jgi:transglutaminase-like putative cysteine protease
VRQGRIREELGPTPVPAGAAPETGFTPRPKRAHPRRAEVRRYDVAHRTVYRYARPVEHSTHVFRLVPFHDRLQSVERSEVSISVEGLARDYEDMFGNQTRRFVVETSYTELAIEARSTVEVLDVDPLAYNPLRSRTEIPLVWMPWHRQVLQPFLLPPELPESELDELVDYGMSFVTRNDQDLLETLLDLNDTIHREYQYVQGTTTLATTPFEVYASRRGVCQDFTNLFICLARLLGVPARYVCGYLHTGPRSESRAASDESHAWAQVYLPEVGWRGFDPTNGVLTQTDHVRVAVGRNYRDATPTSGTIYVGGGGERLEVAVKVERVG